MKHVFIDRIKDLCTDSYSIGVCKIKNENETFGGFYHSLERGWLNNKRGISCIPVGTYDLKLEFSPKFNTNLWEIYGVPNRSECKFHPATFWEDLEGCIALGFTLFDVNFDGTVDLTNSKNALAHFHKLMAGETKAKLTINYR